MYHKQVCAPVAQPGLVPERAGTLRMLSHGFESHRGRHTVMEAVRVREPTPYKEGTQELDKSVGLHAQANSRAIRGQAIAEMAGAIYKGPRTLSGPFSNT